ncbi:hypothetical protein SLT36_25400 [Aminobacter sp. BA135]|uniref:hypothetical protein n=1 Tax=Aminobacter sp. BA135 TaxID=537596 RepID=UPI003D7B692A
MTELLRDNESRETAEGLEIFAFISVIARGFRRGQCSSITPIGRSWSPGFNCKKWSNLNIRADCEVYLYPRLRISAMCSAMTSPSTLPKGCCRRN